MGTARVGVSGWSYDGWRGDFYPEGLPRRRQLPFVAERFDAVEVNGSFYSLLSPETYRRYREDTPAEFRFAVKGSRFITHNRKLADVRVPLANFFASGLLLLEGKLDVLLWQLPARHRIDLDRLRTFVDLLPGNVEAAAKLARQHDGRVGEAVTEAGSNHRLRHALEIRNEGDLEPGVARVLRDGGVALAFSHSGRWPLVEEVTAGFVYLRLHGAPETYVDRYPDGELEKWADRIRTWREGKEPPDANRITDRRPPRRKERDVYVFFDNDSEGHAPHDAERLKRLLES